MRTHRIAVSVLAVLTLVGCSSSSTNRDSSNSTAPVETTAAVADTTAAPADTTALPVDTTAVTSAASAETSSPATDTTVPGRLGGIEVSNNGVAGFRFGDDAETVIAGLSELLGAPAEDSGWQASESPCEGMGSKSRTMEFGRLSVNFATGPTLFVIKPGEHFSSYILTDGNDTQPPVGRFLFADRLPALGRNKAKLLAWNRSVTFENNDIQGSIWSLGHGKQLISGQFDVLEGGTDPVVRTVEAGLFCFD